MRAVLMVMLLGMFFANGAERWWSHVQFLASDEMKGRDTGSAEHRKAALYIASQFERAGLKPAGEQGYLQKVSFRSRRIVEEKSSLVLLRDGKSEPVVLGDEATFSMRIEPPASVEAPLVFVGYGLTVPEEKYDDLAGLDLKNKVALLVTGGPESIPGPLLAHYQSAGERWGFLKRAGALGVVAVQNPRGQDIPWERSKLARFLPSLTLTDPALDDTAGQQVSVTVNPEHAEKFFAGSGHAFKDVLALAMDRKPLPRFPVPASVRAQVTFEAAAVESENVAGLLPGSDPSLAREVVVLSAHLDHVGVGKPIEGDEIYNGAMDNASGVASLIETAEALHESGTKLRRSVLFLAVTAEEKGLLGSRYFAAHPTVPAVNMVANLNTDMFLPFFPMKSVMVQGLDESDLGDDLRAVGARLGIAVLPDPEPERNAFIRSDQYSFIRRGVPALSLKVGWMKDSPEHETVKRFRTERYHAPSDDLKQPLDFQAAADFNRVYREVVVAIADRRTRPAWKATSFFKRFQSQS